MLLKVNYFFFLRNTNLFIFFIIECPSKCVLCTGVSACTLCKGISSGTGARVVPVCNCPDGYFNNGSDNCVRCDAICNTCSFSGSCSTCIGDLA